MVWFFVKAALSGLIIAAVSEIARRSAGFAALVASLPLVSVLGMIWIWGETRDGARIADHSSATFWFVLPSMPMFLLIPALMRGGMGFWPALGLGCGLTVILYLAMLWLAPKLGLPL